MFSVGCLEGLFLFVLLFLVVQNLHDFFHEVWVGFDGLSRQLFQELQSEFRIAVSAVEDRLAFWLGHASHPRVRNGQPRVPIRTP